MGDKATVRRFVISAGFEKKSRVNWVEMNKKKREKKDEEKNTDHNLDSLPESNVIRHLMLAQEF